MIAIVVLVILLALGIFYTRSVLISSCTVLSAQAVAEAVPFEGTITDIVECPAPEVETIPVNPPSNEPPASGSSGRSSKKIDASPELNESNQSEVTLSPDTEKNTSGESSPFSRSVVDEYIAAHHLNVDCSFYNRTLPGTAVLVILEGYSNSSVFGIDIRVPIKSKLVIADNQIILECIKRPWWSYLLP